MDVNLESLFFMFYGERIEQVKGKEIKELAMICARKAYRDFCRTIKFNGACEKDKEKLKADILSLIAAEVVFLYENSVNIDNWHRALCTKICDTKINGKIIIHIGQAQKWVNMTLKYLRIMGVRCEAVEKDMHIPVDNFIIEAANLPPNEPLLEGMDVHGLGLNMKWSVSWSQLEDYDIYYDFQKELRYSLFHKQLEWEEKAWIAMAQRHAVSSYE